MIIQIFKHPEAKQHIDMIEKLAPKIEPEELSEADEIYLNRIINAYEVDPKYRHFLIFITNHYATTYLSNGPKELIERIIELCKELQEQHT